MGQPIPSTTPGAPVDAGTGGQAPQGTQNQNPPQGGQPTGSGTQQQTGQNTAQDVSSLPEWAQKLITDTRTEAAQHRTAKQSATQEAQAAKAQRDAILKAAGLNPDGTEAPPTPEALTAQIEQERAVAWTSAIELNVIRTALAAGADGDKLLDSRKFIDSLDTFTEDDPRAADFGEKLAAHVKGYVEKHPQFKTTTTTTAPTRAGSDRAAGNGGGTTRQPKGLGAAIRAHYGTG